MRTLKGLLALLLAVSSFMSFVPAVNVEAADFLTDEDVSESSEVPEAWGVVPNANQYKYQKDELAAFVHFGMNTFTGSEWGNGQESPSQFTLTNPFDAETLVKAIYDAGFKKVIVTAKHHDGFCIFRSEFTDHDLEATNYSGDVLAEISAACTRYNLDMGLYLSPWDVNHPSYGYYKEDGTSLIGSNGYPINNMSWEEAEALDYLDYNEYYNNQLIEILSDPQYGNNGRFVEVWMDGAKGGGSAVQWYDFEKWFATIQKYEGPEDGAPADCMLFGAKAYTTVRWIGNENGFAADETWSKSIVDYDAKEQIIYQNQPFESLDNGGTVDSNSSGGYTKGYENGNQWTIGEADARITSGWFWGNSKKTPKSMEQLSDMYFRSVGHNSPLLLNIPPNNQGTVDQDILNRLNEFGTAIKNSFANNIASSGVASASSIYKNSSACKPGNVLDGDDTTYWASGEGTTEAQLVVDLGGTKTFDIVSIEEAIQKGQRIKSVKVEVQNPDGTWKTVGEGATVGAKRLVRFKETKANKVRITMTTTESEILISEVGVFKASRDFEMPNPIPEGLLVVDNTDQDATDGAAFTYTGWTQETGAQYINETNMYANPNAELTLNFTGTKVYLVGTKDPNHGTMEIFIDGVSKGIIDTSATTRSVGQVIYASEDLSDGAHTLRLVVKNRAIGIEAAAVLNNGGKGMFEIADGDFRMYEESERTITINRVGGSVGEASVIVQDNPGTAVQGDYYTTEGIVLTFAEGETSKTAVIRTKRDTKVKGDIFFTLELVEPTNGAITGFNAESVVTIEDLDGYSKETLQELYDQVAGYEAGSYVEGWAAFEAARTEANRVLTAEEAVNYGKAYLALKAAKDGLVGLGSFTESNPYKFPTVVDQSNVLEAEYAQLENSGGDDETWKLAVKDAEWASEGKFVNCLNQDDIIRIPYKADVAGTYEVVVSYRSGDPNNKLVWSDPAGNIVAGEVSAGASAATETKTATFTMTVSSRGSGTLTFTGPSTKSPQLDKFDITLKSVNVDFSALEEAIEAAQAINTNLYTDASVATLTTKVEEGTALLTKEGATQAEADAAAQAINDAVNALVAKPLNEANLINKSAQTDVHVEACDSQYTGETADKTLDYNNQTLWHSDWSGDDALPISITYDLAKEYHLSDIAYLGRQNGSVNGDIFEFDLYVGNDLDNLPLIGHFSVDTTGSGVNEELANKSQFTRVMFDATGRYVKMTVTRSGSDNASKQNRFASMAEIRFYSAESQEEVNPANKEALAAAIAAAENMLLEADKYEEASVAELQAALDAAKVVNNNEVATQEEVDNAKANLEAAIDGMVEKPQVVVPEMVTDLEAEDTNYKTITLTWAESEGATEYDVYRKSYKEGAEFELEATVTEPAYEAVGVMTGKEYTFYVVAKNEAGEADASDVVAMATTLKGTVTLAMEKVSTSKFHLSWNKVDGATRYIVYRKRNDDKMKKVLTLGGDVLEYTTAEMPNGDYQFQVKAGRYDSTDRVMTGASNKVSGTVEALKPTVTATAGTKSAKISWKKMEGVTHYQVYRATSSTGKYTKLVTTKELSYTAKSLTKGKKYYFKVRGYKTYKSGTDIQYTVYTPYSSVKSVTAK